MPFWQAVLLLGAFAYHRGVLGLWFILDDPGAIVRSLDPLKEILFGNAYSYAFYTPLVPLSFKPDVAIFGLNPVPYHIHNCLVLALVAFVACRILEARKNGAGGLLAAAVILFSPPALACVGWATLRQYLYAMLFALLAVDLHLRGGAGSTRRKLAVPVALVLAELSFMGKEQYMTLPLVLFLLSGGGFRERLRRTYPYWLLLAGHLGLRAAVLGGAGGYLGVRYDPLVTLATSVRSIFTASSVLFGWPWFAIVIAAPILRTPRKLVSWIFAWLASLAISFLVLSTLPRDETLRYWFIPAVLFAFATGLALEAIRGRTAKIVYTAAVVLALGRNGLERGEGLRRALAEKAVVSETVSKALVDGAYREDAVLVPDEALASSQYIENMAACWHRLRGVEPTAAFLSVDLLAFFPDVREDYERFFEVTGSSLAEVTDGMDDRIEEAAGRILDARPAVRLIEDNGRTKLDLRCESARVIVGFFISGKFGQVSYGRASAPYLERVDLGPFFGKRRMVVVPIEKVRHRKRAWSVDDRPLGEGEELVALSCVSGDGRMTRLSDAILIAPP